MAAPELSVVCRNCGSEVSPYVTECPYCGTRVRKRAPKLEREGDQIKIREGRREKRIRRDAERRARAQGMRERREERLETRPLATIALLAVPAVSYVVLRASNLSALDLGALLGTPGGEFWRYLAAPFVFDDAGYLFVCGLALVIFLPPIERRISSLGALLLALACGALGMLGADGIDRALGDGFPVAAGANGIALGVLAAYVVMREPERRAEPGDSYDPIAAAVAAAVLLLLPLVESWADPWAGVAGGAVGALCGLAMVATGRRRAA
ncbi:MAG: zinc ribbon domain-containing protein [Actinomycetota bacterium]|nr:zinc ribbon domain-containing protein [Actinomycetota bacterium]